MHLLHVVVQLRAVDKVFTSPAQLGLITDRGQVRMLRDHIDHIHPEAVDALIEPAPHHTVDILTQVGVGPV